MDLGSARVIIVRMRLGAVAAVLLALAVGLPAPAAHAAWQPLGSSVRQEPLPPGVMPSWPGIVDVGGQPWTTWSELTDDGAMGLSVVRVARWDGSQWIDVGGSVGPAGEDAIQPSMVSIMGVPYVAWIGAGPAVRVARWTGITWEAVGVPTPANADDPVTAWVDIANVGGVPYVASVVDDTAADDRIRVRRLQSGAWVDVGGLVDASLAGEGESPALAAIGGVAHVAFRSETASSADIRVGRFDGANWQLLGGALDTAELPSDRSPPEIAEIAGAATVALSQGDGGGGFRLSVVRWNGSAWVDLGGPAVSDYNPFWRPALAALGGTTYAGWIQSTQFHVAGSTTPGTWTPFDTVPVPSDRAAGHPTLAAIGSVLHAGWQQETPAVRTINAARFAPDTPEAPTVTAVTPASPADDNSPKISGTAPAGTTVSLYGNAACSGTALATGTADAFAVPGLTINVADNSTTTVYATATGANGTSACSTTSVTYVEDSTPATVRFSSATATVAESTSPVALTVTRAGGTGSVATVEYATTAGSATAGTDYTTTSGTLTFAAGETSKPIAVPVLDNGAVEPDETFTVTLSSPGGATLGAPATATVTITDDDTPRTLRFAAATASVPEQSGPAVLTVRREGPLTGAVSVGFVTESGTAGVLTDFFFTEGTLTFAAGESEKTVSVPIVNDTATDPDETFRVKLQSPTGGAVLTAPSEVAVTIVDDEVIDTRITAAPAAPTSDATPELAFTAVPAQPGATFECWFDLGTPAPCSSPFSPSTPLSDGEHTFRVRATSAGGQADPSPATAAFVVDTAPPVVTLRLEGTGLASGSYAGTVGVGADANDPAPATGVAEVRCIIDPPSAPATFGDMRAGPCGSVAQAGLHAAYAAAIDAAGNASAVTKTTFRIAEPPETIITSGPEGTSYNTTPGFTFQSNVAGATLVCRLDDAPPAPCRSPLVTTPLKPGAHVFEVFAISPEGVGDATPARRTFAITAASTKTFSCEFQPVDVDRPPGCELADRGFRECRKNWRCEVTPAPACPAGARCQGFVTARWVDQDFAHVWRIGAVPAFDYFDTGIIPSFAFCSIGDIAPWTGCSEVSNSTAPAIGDGKDAIRLQCFVDGSPSAVSSNARFGPVQARRFSCDFRIEVQPAAALMPLGQGASGVQVFTPAPGQVALTFGSQNRAAGFKALTKTVQAAGPVSFKVKLNRSARRTLRRKALLKLPVSVSFAPAGGGEVLRRTARIALRKVAKPAKRCGKFRGKRVCA